MCGEFYEVMNLQRGRHNGDQRSDPRRSHCCCSNSRRSGITKERIDTKGNRPSGEGANSRSCVVGRGERCTRNRYRNEFAIAFHGFNCRLVCASLGCKSELFDEGPKRRNNGDGQCANQQEAVMALFEVGSLVSEEDLPLPRAQGVEQAIGHHNAPGFSWSCVCDGLFGIENLEPTASCSGDGPSMIDDDFPHSDTSSKKQDRCDRAFHKADFVMEWDDRTHLEKCKHHRGASKESSSCQRENRERSSGRDRSNEGQHPNGRGRAHGPPIQASRDADQDHQQTREDEGDGQTV